VTGERQRGISGDAPRVSTAERQPAPPRHPSLTKAHRLLAVSGAGLAGVLLGACGSDDSDTESNNAPERPNTIMVVGADRLAFEPDEFTIAAGLEFTLELTAGCVEHVFVIEEAAEYGSTEAGHQAEDPDDLHVAHADAGDTVTATFTIERAGTYTVYCSVAGHRDAGMVATLEVISVPE
jgi:uncharacterized cupredoxin-like copper-binding protein